MYKFPDFIYIGTCLFQKKKVYKKLVKISVICQKWNPEQKKLHYPGSPNTTLKYTFREIVLRVLAECNQFA